MGPEAIIEQYLVKNIKNLGGLCFKFISPGNAGVPDRIVIYKKHIIFVELKSMDGRLSKQQLHIHALMRNQGVYVWTLCSKKDVNTLMEALEC